MTVALGAGLGAGDTLPPPGVSCLSGESGQGAVAGAVRMPGKRCEEGPGRIRWREEMEAGFPLLKGET